MLSDLHNHIVGELQQNSRTDVVFVVSAVLFNLVVLGINWGVASEANNPDQAAGLWCVVHERYPCSPMRVTKQTGVNPRKQYQEAVWCGKLYAK